MYSSCRISEKGVAVIAPLSTVVDVLAGGEGNPVLVASSEPSTASSALEFFGVVGDSWVTLLSLLSCGTQ
jgi:hypothetical protein